MWIALDLFLVQILVQVAIRIMKFNSMKENNGFKRMANDFEWLGIKEEFNYFKRRLYVVSSLPKMNLVKIPKVVEDEYNGDIDANLNWYNFQIINN